VISSSAKPSGRITERSAAPTSDPSGRRREARTAGGLEGRKRRWRASDHHPNRRRPELVERTAVRRRGDRVTRTSWWVASAARRNCSVTASRIERVVRTISLRGSDARRASARLNSEPPKTFRRRRPSAQGGCRHAARRAARSSPPLTPSPASPPMTMQSRAPARHPASAVDKAPRNGQR